MKRMHLSPALVVSLIALFVALGGTSYAAINSLPQNSVGTAQLKNGAVTPPKINASASLHPTIYALVGAQGIVDTPQSSGFNSVLIRGAGPGIYCFHNLPFTPKGGSVTMLGAQGSNEGTGYLTISDSGQAPDCLPGESVEVVTDNGVPGDVFPESFYLVLYG